MPSASTAEEDIHIGTVTPASFSAFAASTISCQVVGCHSAPRPAFYMAALLYHRPRVSVSEGMPYTLPSAAVTPAVVAA